MGLVSKRRTFEILALSMLLVPIGALGDAHIASGSGMPKAGSRGVVEELDAGNEADCLSMGELDIVFRTANSGPPHVGVVLTDPRGRRIGFDPVTKDAWQSLPVAEGYINCDDLDGTNACRGIVQVCGPVSGSYKLELSAQKATVYSVNVSARSKEIAENGGIHAYRSQTELKDVAIRGRARDIVLLNYSRDRDERVTAELQRPPRARSLSRSQRGGEVQPSGRSGGQ